GAGSDLAGVGPGPPIPRCGSATTPRFAFRTGRRRLGDGRSCVLPRRLNRAVTDVEFRPGRGSDPCARICHSLGASGTDCATHVVKLKIRWAVGHLSIPLHSVAIRPIERNTNRMLGFWIAPTQPLGGAPIPTAIGAISLQ